MKKILLFTALVIGWSFSQAQTLDSWRIRWNNKTILETNKESESANIRKISKNDLKKNYTLNIRYTEASEKKESDWTRSFLFFDDKGEQLMKKDSTRNLTLKSSELKKLFAGNKKIKIYTIAIPTDPELASRVRVRRVHLCTLELK